MRRRLVRRGPALLDVEHGRLLRAAVADLDESRLDTLSLFFNTQLIVGQHREMLTELARLVVRYPHHERLHTQFMIALYQSGYRTQALKVYDELARNMLTELDMAPSSQIAELRQAIHAADTAAVDDATRRIPPRRTASAAPPHGAAAAPASRPAPDRT